MNKETRNLLNKTYDIKGSSYSLNECRVLRIEREKIKRKNNYDKKKSEKYLQFVFVETEWNVFVDYINRVEKDKRRKLNQIEDLAHETMVA